jgi:hypothetical protein
MTELTKQSSLHLRFRTHHFPIHFQTEKERRCFMWVCVHVSAGVSESFSALEERLLSSPAFLVTAEQQGLFA